MPGPNDPFQANETMEQVYAVLVDTNGNPTGGASAPQAVATDRSGTITAGNTAQDLMPANTSRLGWFIENLSSGDLWVNGKGAAGTTLATLSQPSFKVPAGGYWQPPYTTPHAVSVIGATTGQAFCAREW